MGPSVDPAGSFRKSSSDSSVTVRLAVCHGDPPLSTGRALAVCFNSISSRHHALSLQLRRLSRTCVSYHVWRDIAQSNSQLIVLRRTGKQGAVCDIADTHS